MEHALIQPRGLWVRMEALLVWLVALHSAAIGVGGLVATRWGLRFAGFDDVSPLFFPRQVGIFHLVVASAYAIEYTRYRGVTILLVTKAIAVAFLPCMMAIEHQPWIVPVAAGGDALMALAVLVVRRRAERERTR